MPLYEMTMALFRKLPAAREGRISCTDHLLNAPPSPHWLASPSAHPINWAPPALYEMKPNSNFRWSIFQEEICYEKIILLRLSASPFRSSRPPEHTGAPIPSAMNPAGSIGVTIPRLGPVAGRGIDAIRLGRLLSPLCAANAPCLVECGRTTACLMPTGDRGPRHPPMKSTNGLVPRAWKKYGALPERGQSDSPTPNPSAADVRGHRLGNVVA
jgi:hypothetical protein